MTKVKLIKQILKKGGTRLLYSALLLFYAFKRKDLPAWAKSIVIGALGYLLSPIDAILVLIAAYINDDVREKARHRLEKLIGHHADKHLIRTVEHFL